MNIPERFLNLKFQTGLNWTVFLSAMAFFYSGLGLVTTLIAILNSILIIGSGINIIMISWIDKNLRKKADLLIKNDLKEFEKTTPANFSQMGVNSKKNVKIVKTRKRQLKNVHRKHYKDKDRKYLCIKTEKPFEEKMTNDWNHVTCKNCLRANKLKEEFKGWYARKKNKTSKK